MKFILMLWLFVFSELFAEPVQNDPTTALMSIIDRPTVAYSAFLAPKKKFVFESGYQYQTNYPEAGHVQTYPQSELRYGLSESTEIDWLIPSYNTENKAPFSGFSGTLIGGRHQFINQKHWVATGQVLLAPASGSKAYGYQKFGAVFNGILSYAPNAQFSFTTMMGVSQLSDPNASAGQTYFSFNPILVGSYNPTPKLAFYTEIYGQTHTGYQQGSGVNFDSGIIYLLTPNIVLDCVYSHRISGTLYNANDYIGTGVSFMF